MNEYDVVIVGAGPAGSVAATTLARQGLRCAIVEKEEFPRLHIGESLTAGAGELLRELGVEKQMVAHDFPVKHGVLVYGSGGKNSFYVPVRHRKPDGTVRETTWQVRRSTFDTMLLDLAQDEGAELVRGSALSPIQEDGRIVGVEVETGGGVRRLGSRMLIDASGQHTFLSRAGVASEKRRGNYDRQIAIYTHVEGAQRIPDGPTRDDTVILYRESRHWAWFIPIERDVTSVGTVVPASYFRSTGETPSEFLEREFRELNPELALRTAGATWTLEPQIIKNYSYIIDEYTGPGWICVGDSHRFTDPVFSFGVHLGMHEGRRGAEIVAGLLAGDLADEAGAMADYRAYSEQGQGMIQDLVDAFWNEPLAFGYVAHRKHHEDIVDLFAGRLYDADGEPSAGLKALRAINAKAAAVSVG